MATGTATTVRPGAAARPTTSGTTRSRGDRVIGLVSSRDCGVPRRSPRGAATGRGGTTTGVLVSASGRGTPSIRGGDLRGLLCLGRASRGVTSHVEPPEDGGSGAVGITDPTRTSLGAGEGAPGASDHDRARAAAASTPDRPTAAVRPVVSGVTTHGRPGAPSRPGSGAIAGAATGPTTGVSVASTGRRATRRCGGMGGPRGRLGATISGRRIPLSHGGGAGRSITGGVKGSSNGAGAPPRRGRGTGPAICEGARAGPPTHALIVVRGYRGRCRRATRLVPCPAVGTPPRGQPAAGRVG